MSDPTESAIEQVGVALAGECALPAGNPIVAACSGGADSVFLVHALAAHQDTWPLASVVFIDHGLREVTTEARASRGAAEAPEGPRPRARLRPRPRRLRRPGLPPVPSSLSPSSS